MSRSATQLFSLLLLVGGFSCLGSAADAAVEVTAQFRQPTVVHQSFNGQHAWFSSAKTLPMITSHDGDSSPLVMVSCSLGGDGKPCPPPGKQQNCSLSAFSRDSGTSWSLFNDWSKHAPDAVVPMANGSFVLLPYGLRVNYTTNTTATNTGSIAHIEASGSWVWDEVFEASWSTRGAVKWPSLLVHSGSVLRLSDQSILTTVYGRGESDRSGVYFVSSTDEGRTWSYLASIPWRPVYGPHPDGPAEPSTALLPDGRLLCVFRAHATEFYWRATSSDNGRTWTTPTPMNVSAGGQWSVKPRLRIVGDLLVLTGGRPGLNMWVSTDFGTTWQRWNLAAVHNSLIGNASLEYEPIVVNASSPSVPTANPPQTSSYTGVAILSNNTIIISYDRLANGWSGPPGPYGNCDTLFAMRVELSKNPTRRKVAVKQYQNPVLSHDFPDPTVIRAPNGTFYGYATMGAGHHLQVASSPNLVNWTYHGEAMPTPPSWGDGECHWAPDVQYHDGTYWMYYGASTSRAAGRCSHFCIGVATSTDPLGPFSDLGKPIVCGPGFDHIDPKSFDDPFTNKTYLYWGSAGQPLRMRELNRDRKTFADGSEVIEVLQPNASNPYESLVEGTWIHYDPPSQYYFLIYSGNACCGEHANYALMSARSKSVTGPYEKLGQVAHQKSSTFLEQTPKTTGTSFFAVGHNCMISVGGEQWTLYHGYHKDPKGAGPRTLLLDRIRFLNLGGGLGVWPVAGVNGSASAGLQPAPIV